MTSTIAAGITASTMGLASGFGGHAEKRWNIRYGAGHGSTTDTLDSELLKTIYLVNTYNIANHLTHIDNDGKLKGDLPRATSPVTEQYLTCVKVLVSQW